MPKANGMLGVRQTHESPAPASHIQQVQPRHTPCHPTHDTPWPGVQVSIHTKAGSAR